jgi:endonuclease YncB( thermonuclease family)
MPAQVSGLPRAPARCAGGSRWAGGPRRAAILALAVRAFRGPIFRGLVLGALVLGSVPGALGAAERLAGPLPAQVVSVLDGDTIEVRVHIWLGQDINTRVRLAGIDAPELKGKCDREKTLALRARAYLVARLGPVEAAGGAGRVQLREIRYGKFAGRVLAQVETLDGMDLGRSLIAAGLARPYDGRRRASWCEAAGTTPAG